jgi:hypothetical protein
MLLDEAKSLTDFPPGKAGMLGQFDSGFKPELGLAVLPLNMHMHMHSRFFPRNEMEPETALAENGWTHGRNDTPGSAEGYPFANRRTAGADSCRLRCGYFDLRTAARMPCIRASGVGGQPGMRRSTPTTFSIAPQLA